MPKSFLITEQNAYNLPVEVETEIYISAEKYYAGSYRFHPDDDADDMVNAYFDDVVFAEGDTYEFCWE